ncbi:MAG TPA: hypothetical protein PKM41_08925 [Deltaproteobacteria bacterium]|nr:hypothetical protein [Deltaproteobacteria bacterium]HOI07400.1 hypothetical protein [Deltaproteobacteria bacterium]
MKIRLWYMIALMGIILFGLGLAGCSHDDDDDPAVTGSEQISGDGQVVPTGTDEPEGKLAIPASFDFDLIMNATTSSPFIISQGRNVPQRAMVMADMTPQTLSGTVTPGQEDETSGEVTSGEVTFNGGNVLNVTAWNFWNEDTRALTITLLQPLTFPQGITMAEEAPPVSGSYTVTSTLAPGQVETVTVVFSEPGEGEGVSLRLNEGIPSPMSPDIFEVLLNSTVPAWQEKAAFSYIVLKQLAQGVALSAQTVSLALANQGELEAATAETGEDGYVAVGGEGLTLNGDPGTTVVGSAVLIWSDDTEEGDVSTGDSFQWRFFNQWENSPGVLANDLTNGRVDLTGFILDTVPRDGDTAVTRTGFRTTGGNQPGVLFTDFQQEEIGVNRDGDFVIIPNRTFITDGGFDILFTERAPAEG